MGAGVRHVGWALELFAAYWTHCALPPLAISQHMPNCENKDSAMPSGIHGMARRWGGCWWGGGAGGPWGAHVSTTMRIRVEVHEARWAIPLRFIYISSCGCVPPTQGLRHGAPAARGYRLAPSVPWHCADAALPIVSLSAMYFFEHHDAPWPSPRTCSRSAFSETYFCDDA